MNELLYPLFNAIESVIRLFQRERPYEENYWQVEQNIKDEIAQKEYRQWCGTHLVHPLNSKFKSLYLSDGMAQADDMIERQKRGGYIKDKYWGDYRFLNKEQD